MFVVLVAEIVCWNLINVVAALECEYLSNVLLQHVRQCVCVCVSVCVENRSIIDWVMRRADGGC